MTFLAISDYGNSLSTLSAHIYVVVMTAESVVINPNSKHKCKWKVVCQQAAIWKQVSSIYQHTNVH